MYEPVLYSATLKSAGYNVQKVKCPYVCLSVPTNRHTKKTFCGFSLAVISTGPGVFMVCVCFIYRKHPKAQPIVVLEKPRIEPTTPGLQGNPLIHYITTA